jgi:hypothetical protein
LLEIGRDDGFGGQGGVLGKGQGVPLLPCYLME